MTGGSCKWDTPTNNRTCCASIEIQAKARNVTDILYRDTTSDPTMTCNVSRLASGQFCR